jgi:5-methylcytosine-specific restriction protein A
MPDLPAVYRGPRRTAQHKSRKAKQRQASRGLPTYSKQWRAIRERVLYEEPLCRECKANGKITAATQVDHIDEDSHNNSRDNLQALCAPCHSRKTAANHGNQNASSIAR